MSDTRAESLYTPHSSELQDDPVVRHRGAWSYDHFGNLILRMIGEHGEDSALAHVQNIFPRVEMDDARLWIAYIKSCKDSPFDPCIMNGFRTTSYVRVIRDGNGSELFPELARLLRGLDETHAEGVNRAPHCHSPSGSRRTEHCPRAGNAAPTNTTTFRARRDSYHPSPDPATTRRPQEETVAPFPPSDPSITSQALFERGGVLNTFLGHMTIRSFVMEQR
ncbi:hypothetical protein AURDEDRAFT_125910 [Auricularia subglabra TFB-10046 SS5]|nr:hypothetical protein AURDEDRAFT_125910 [Auricularia subglabra TFB-10046 SS5]